MHDAMCEARYKTIMAWKTDATQDGARSVHNWGIDRRTTIKVVVLQFDKKNIVKNKYFITAHTL